MKNHTTIETPTEIMVVDDIPANLELLSNILKAEGYKVRSTIDPQSAIDAAKIRPPDLILLDIRMPGMNGYEVCHILKQDEATQGIPVIFVTALNETDDKLKGFEAGGVDFIAKPFEGLEVLARVKTHLDLHQMQVKMEELVAQRTAELKRSETQYRLLAENTSDVIWTTDLSEKITYISPSIKALRGYTPEEAIKQRLEEKITSSYISILREAIQKTTDSSTLSVLEVEQPCKDGSTVWVEMHIKNFLDDSGNRIGLIGTSRNIDQRKRAEEQTKLLESQLQQAQKMESIGTLAGGIAHDFNNILSAILGFSEIALEDITKDSSLFNPVQEIVKAGNRAKELVNQILTFSRKTEREVKPLDASLLIKEALKLLRSSIPSTIEIKKYIDPDCGLVLADPTQIHQIVMNLCTNAYHAMRETGGILTVSLKPVELGFEDLIYKIDLQPGPYLILTVSDTGNGIPRHLLEKIFEPYFTTKGIGEGTGLGLSVVHGIVKGLHGGIKVYSEPGQGTVFRIYLPVITEERATGHKEDTAIIPGGNEHILCVDDEERLVQINKMLLESLGYSVTGETNSVNAFNIFKDAPEKFDLIISDITMPGMTGIELVRKILEIRPDMPVILCSGYSDILYSDNTRKAGAREYASKPILKKDLARMVRNVLDQNKKQ